MNDYNNSLTLEIQQHIATGINDLIDVDVTDLHHELFNTDYYIIGYYNAREWLKLHEFDSFDAVEFVQEYERDNFGESHTPVNSERIVNMVAYIVGEQVLWECLNNLKIDSDGVLSTEDAEAIAEYLNDN